MEMEILNWYVFAAKDCSPNVLCSRNFEGAWTSFVEQSISNIENPRRTKIIIIKVSHNSFFSGSYLSYPIGFRGDLTFLIHIWLFQRGAPLTTSGELRADGFWGAAGMLYRSELHGGAELLILSLLILLSLCCVTFGRRIQLSKPELSKRMVNKIP